MIIITKKINHPKIQSLHLIHSKTSYFHLNNKNQTKITTNLRKITKKPLKKIPKKLSKMIIFQMRKVQKNDINIHTNIDIDIGIDREAIPDLLLLLQDLHIAGIGITDIEDIINITDIIIGILLNIRIIGTNTAENTIQNQNRNQNRLKKLKKSLRKKVQSQRSGEHAERPKSKSKRKTKAKRKK